MPPIGLIVILVIMNGWLLRTVVRYVAARRHPTDALPGRRGTLRLVTAAPALATDSIPQASPVPESCARAFPLNGLLPGGGSMLEGLLRHVAGVTRAYVSPVTALAYVDYLPGQVTEEQLVGAISGGGYRVDTATSPFDWRHGHPG